MREFPLELKTRSLIKQYKKSYKYKHIGVTVARKCTLHFYKIRQVRHKRILKTVGTDNVSFLARSISTPPENIRKPKVSSRFLEVQK